MTKILKFQFTTIAIFFCVTFLKAQQNLDLTLYPEDFVTTHWKEVNTASLDISEVAFVNWNSGGSNSISGLLGLEAQRNYKKDHLVWENRAVVRYGVNKQQNQSLRKTDDILELKSRFGFRQDTKSNWYYSANFSFATQFTNGYNYSNSDSSPISKFMAPAYMFLGVGTVYGEHIEEFNAYLSPLTLKSTFVLDQNLADAGSFGVTPATYDALGNKLTDGENSRKEVGILMTSSYENILMNNISVRNLVSLYTDYLNDFGNVDVDWEINFKFKVNDHVRATMGSHLKYDNDVKTAVVDEDMPEETIEKGAKVQWKQLLGIGVLVNF
ncbi:DUF3078 domain-containing protein [Pontimicrobium aquaticum]|uniref:DUF3078 domain-containing protein n=1 Tax=Pontimicrobium aquaticum TaxID=2565367 RepID=A0A4U0EZ22_9FLAO|nr:DUF3078 domain-containing protein [Pontimicrobium aquaticum]TJY37283.1 DUF3078 domain-containing protein [Pontimicrobium aquaticum]